MSKNQTGQSGQWRKIKPPSDSIRKHYELTFKRNQMKFIRRSQLGVDHLGAEFTSDGDEYRLVGTVTEHEMIIENMSDKSCYMVHCDIVTKMVLEGKS